LEEKANSGLPQYGLGDNPMGIFPEFGQEQVEPPKIDPVTGLVIYDDPKYHISFQYPPNGKNCQQVYPHFQWKALPLRLCLSGHPAREFMTW
jgi:hypothetical protein